jgi:diguanylate cyclase (GGDEF)-like protein
MMKYLLRLGFVNSIIFLTCISVIGSILITIFMTIVLDHNFSTINFEFAVIVPLFIAPVLSYFYLGLLFQLEQLRSEAQLISITDDLTQAYTRRHFFKVANQELSRSIRHQLPLSLLLIDIDDFKRVNDVYGHLAGDKVLQEMSKICRDAIRLQDVFARYGGEEFILLLPQIEFEQAVAAARRIHGLVSDQRYWYDDQPIHVTISFGVTTLDQEEVTLDTLLKRVDAALYEAKHCGKNCIRVA